MILATNESGPYIDIQHPKNLSDELQVKSSVLLSLFNQHRISRREPHYIEMKIKKEVSVAIFFTGFSYDRYVGKPIFEIIVFLSEEDVLTKNFEGMLRRIAHELLPQQEAPVFRDLLVDYYELLEKQQLGPYWEESSGKIERVEKIESIESSEVKNKLNAINEEKDMIQEEEAMSQDQENIDNLLDKIKPDLETKKKVQENAYIFENQFETLDKEQLINVIHQLQHLVKEKNKTSELINKKLNEQASVQIRPSQDNEAIEKQLDEQNLLLAEWRKKIDDLDKKNRELNDTVMKLKGKSNYQAKEIKSKSLMIDELTKKLEEKGTPGLEIKNIENIKGESERLQQKIKALTQKVEEQEKSLESQKDNEKIKSENEDFQQKIKKLSQKLEEKEKIILSQKEIDIIKNKNLNLTNELQVFNSRLKEKDKIIEASKNFDKIKNDNENLKKLCEDLNKKIVLLKEESEKSKTENNLHIDAIANLKIEIKNLRQDFSAKLEAGEKISDQIIDLKKEVKVLRRERDTYLKTIKEHDLL